MKLFYLQGSCALAPHIALEHAGLVYEAVRVDRGKQAEASYLRINPLGRVPALATASHGTITEVPAVLMYIAEAATDCSLIPSVGTAARYDALRWMAYLSSTVHPALGRLWRAERFAVDAIALPAVQQAAAAELASDFAHIERRLEDRQWLTGDQLSVADFYLFVFGRLGLRLAPSTREFPNFHRHTLAIARLPAAQRAMSQQGIALEGPQSGPG